ncbi:MAG TPA: hypothetical protein VG273_17325 [Bryobacteraceae bacterium]|jgi:hypothetical protein|nr:hypothetical protein [Bryobacteraceae bacterium]
MKTRYILTVSALALMAGSSLHATNMCPGGGLACVSVSSGQNALTGTSFSIVANGTGQDISPYSGSLATTLGSITTTTPLTLYCDDVNNDAPINTWWNVNISQVTGDLSETRYGSANPVGSSGNLPNTSIPIPTGSTLYEEEAWLYTQMMDLTGAQKNSTNITALQEAAWELTSNGESRAEETNASPWLTAAYNAVASNGKNGASVNGVTLHIATYADWFVLTDTSAAGNTGSVGNQELLAYSASGSFVTAQTGAVPEPPTYWLLAGSLLMFARFKFSRRPRERARQQTPAPGALL